jgi:hypothetical protein
MTRNGIIIPDSCKSISCKSNFFARVANFKESKLEKEWVSAVSDSVTLTTGLANLTVSAMTSFTAGSISVVVIVAVVLLVKHLR